MSAVTPDEDIFYAIGLLHSSGGDDWKPLENQNKEILQFCNKAGIKIKLYLSRYTTKEDWMKHFGPKWKTFEDRKAQFDPKMILSPGHFQFYLGFKTRYLARGFESGRIILDGPKNWPNILISFTFKPKI